MELNSSAFRDNQVIPVEHAMPGAGGKNISIPLRWTGVPKNTESFALSVIDPHPVANNWVHWLVVNIPPQVTELPAGASGNGMPAGSLELRNSFGEIGYGGPQPPSGTGEHPYVVTVYALNTPDLHVKQNISLTDFEKAIKGKTLAKTEITGTFTVP